MHRTQRKKKTARIDSQFNVVTEDVLVTIVQRNPGRVLITYVRQKRLNLTKTRKINHSIVRLSSLVGRPQKAVFSFPSSRKIFEQGSVLSMRTLRIFGRMRVVEWLEAMAENYIIACVQLRSYFYVVLDSAPRWKLKLTATRKARYL